MSKKTTLPKCPPNEVALKSFFLGPQAENKDFLKEELLAIFDAWVDWRKQSFPQDGIAIPKSDQQSPNFQKKIRLIQKEVQNVSDLFLDEFPKFSPRYISHMFSEFSMPALLGHFMTLLHNPNNVSKEASNVGVEIEKSAIQDLGVMLGYGKKSLGHFTSGGTIANFEAVLRAKNKWLRSLQSSTEQKLDMMSDFQIGKWIEKEFKIDFEGPALLVPASKHYSWVKAASHFGLGQKGLKLIELDRHGQMDPNHLKKVIDDCLKRKQPILAVVSICGTTELATIDPHHQVQALLDTYLKKEGMELWHHIDAAYGGFFTTLKGIKSPLLTSEMMKSLQAMGKSTSITIDPHKLGYVPYASGAFLCREATDYILTETNAPYLAFDHKKDRGAFTFEGSRSAAGAVATYLTSRCIGFNKNGYGKIIHRSIECTDLMKKTLESSGLPILLAHDTHTNILGFAIGVKTKKQKLKLSEVNRQTLQLLEKINAQNKKSPHDTFYVSKTKFGNHFSKLVQAFTEKHKIIHDTDELVIVRLTMMNPFLNSKHTKTNFINEFTKMLSELI